MNTPQSRLLSPLPVAAGAAAVAALYDHLVAAFGDPAALIAPLPRAQGHISNGLRSSLEAALAPELPVTDADTWLMLTTSGSTGAPKAVAHSQGAIRHSVAALHDLLGGAGDWLCALPLHTSAGFMTVARAALAGTAAVGISSLGGAEPFTADAFIAGTRALQSNSRRYVSLVPTMAQRLLADAAGRSALAEYSAVLLGGQAIPATLVAQLQEAGITTVLSYGATETCGGCVYDGLPLRDVHITIDAEQRIQISGPVVMLGYRNRVTGAIDHVATDTTSSQGQRSLLMPDFGRISGQGYLEVLGRADDIVAVNGINVSLTAVERLLHTLGINALACASTTHIFAITSASLGPDEHEAAMMRAQEELGVRIHFRVHADIPQTAAGKPDRVALASIFAGDTRS